MVIKMNVVLISLAVFFAVCGAAFIYAGKKTALAVNLYRREDLKFKAVVLDVHKEKVNTAKLFKTKKAVILQFRNEPAKKTIIHKYTGLTCRKYRRGDTVDLFFDEENNTALIDDDNVYVIVSKLMYICSLILFAASVLTGAIASVSVWRGI
jgi:hypothetical protein